MLSRSGDDTIVVSGRQPSESCTFDLVVVGGGLAGLCAAVAAARHGIKTAIVQERAMFGGNSSTEIRVVPLSATNFNAWARETGIVEELILGDRATNHAHLFEHGLTNSHWDLVLLEAARSEPNLTMFLNTTVRHVESEPVDMRRPEGARRVGAVHGSQLGSEREYTFYARQFVDATGDGSVAALAGAESRYGRDARSEYGEPMAPLVADEATNGSTITMRARDIGRDVPYTPPPWVKAYRSLDDIGPFRKVAHLKRKEYGGYWWLEVSNPFHQIRDNQAIKDELHRHVLGVWNYIKNHSPDKEIAKTYVLEWIGMVPGKRESRRVLGDVVLNEHHLHADPLWPDRIGIAGWIIDLHIPGGINNHAEPGELSHADANYRNYIHVSPFSVPLRAFYSRNVENLWLAGRNLSASRVAFGAVRVQGILGLLGQAVGTAAAYALSNGLSPRATADPEGTHIGRVQQLLLRDDVHVPGVVNQDEADLARTATARATSEAPLCFGTPDTTSFQPLHVGRAQVFPVTHNRVEGVSYYLKNGGDISARTVAELHELTRIWDSGPGKHIATVTLDVPANFEGWVEAPFATDVTPNRPYRATLGTNPDLLWAAASVHPTGTLAQAYYTSPGGPEPHNRHYPSLSPEQLELPAYERWTQNKWFSLALQVTPQPLPFKAGNVNSGAAWPLSMPNLWVSDPDRALPQCVALDFPEPTTIDTVMLSFDTDLNLIASNLREFWRAPTCVRDWRLYATVDGERRLLFEEADNYQRRRTATFAPVTATSIEIEVRATNAVSTSEPEPGGHGDEVYPHEGGHPREVTPSAGDSARVYEIRVYYGGSDVRERSTLETKN